MPNDAVHAPWSPRTVIALNQQQHGVRHSYTCPLPNHPVETAPKLVATRGGWICSEAPDCEYTQDWAHLEDVKFLEELNEWLIVPDKLPSPARSTSVRVPVDSPADIDELAKVAYTTYSVTAGGKAVNGDPLPEWDEVRPHVRTCWLAAVRSVLRKLEEQPRMPAVPITLPGDEDDRAE